MTHVVRVWLDDRPGAFAEVATAIGALGVDLVGFDILETGGGRAIDELFIELHGSSPSELTGALDALRGVDVEDVRPVRTSVTDPRLDALDAAGALVEAAGSRGLLETLVGAVLSDFDADWVCVLDRSSMTNVVASGPVPTPQWCVAFVAGAAETPEMEAPDVAWAAMSDEQSLVMGRENRPLRNRERRQLEALTRIAGLRHAQLLPG